MFISIICSFIVYYYVLLCCVKERCEAFSWQGHHGFWLSVARPQSDCQTDRGDICQIISTEVIFVTLSNRDEGDICQIVKESCMCCLVVQLQYHLDIQRTEKYSRTTWPFNEASARMSEESALHQIF